MEPINVVFHHEVGEDWQRYCEGLADQGLRVGICAERDDDRFYRQIGEAEVVWHWLRPLGAADMDRAPRLRLIQKIGVGVNTIDLAAAAARNIAVCNMPGTNSRAAAEMTLLLMLAALRRLSYFDGVVRRGTGWTVPTAAMEAQRELCGMRVGLVGYGSIPSLLTPWLTAMGATVAYHSRRRRAEAPVPYLPLEELLAASDIVSLHLPLVPETKGLLSRDRITLMKPGAILINTGRGALVDEGALVAALRSGRLGAAGLDVFAEEPVPAGHPLLAMENVVLTPHIAGVTNETMERSLGIAIENCRRLRAGTDLQHRVA